LTAQAPQGDFRYDDAARVPGGLQQPPAARTGHVVANRDVWPPWQPISDAPRDGTTVFATNWKMGQRGMVSFNGHEWEMVDGLTNLPMDIGFYPTHWMPLPPQPNGA
jgi:hypothetical protein